VISFSVISFSVISYQFFSYQFFSEELAKVFSPTANSSTLSHYT